MSAPGRNPWQEEPQFCVGPPAPFCAAVAVCRAAVNASLYFGLSLGITFPLNILFGIPLYIYVAKAVLA